MLHVIHMWIIQVLHCSLPPACHSNNKNNNSNRKICLLCCRAQLQTWEQQIVNCMQIHAAHIKMNKMSVEMTFELTWHRPLQLRPQPHSLPTTRAYSKPLQLNFMSWAADMCVSVCVCIETKIGLCFRLYACVWSICNSVVWHKCKLLDTAAIEDICRPSASTNIRK